VNTSELLFLAARAGVEFWLDDGRLAYRAPKGAMTSDLRDAVVLHKDELISMLQRARLDAAFPAPRPAATDAAGATGATGATEDSESPLASGQSRLWLIERRLGPSPLYNTHFRLLWRGVLDRDILALSIADVCARHAAMRTTFPQVDGLPVAVISQPADVELPHLDLRGLATKTKKNKLNAFAADHQRAPFDMERGPLIRAAVVTADNDDQIVLFTQHHIATDGYSIRIFLSELGDSYRARYLGLKPSRPQPTLRYADYVCWERQRRAEPAYSQRLAWWQEHLAGLPPLVLPHQRHELGTGSLSGAVERFSVPVGLTRELKDLASDQQCTLYTVLLTAWAILLHRYASQADFAIGTVTSGRDRPEFQNVIGFFANTVVFRCDLSGNPTTTEAISRLRAETESVFANEVPFADIVMSGGKPHESSLAPLINVAFMFPNLPKPEFLSPGDAQRVGAEVTVDGRVDGSVEGTSKFDLFLTVQESGKGIKGDFEYSTAKFSAATIRRLGEHFRTILASIAENPEERIGRLRLITRQEQSRILAEWGAGQA